jgi:nicotinamidase-related amidase
VHGWEALPALETVLGSARAAGVLVIHTTGENRADARLGAATHRGPAPGENELAGYDIVPSLQPLAGELVAHKGRASAFFGTPVSTWLRQLGVDTLIVAGETTSGCVRASVVDAYSHGFAVVVVEEATFDRNTLSHKVNLYDMHLKYASVLHLEEVLELLAATRENHVGAARG